MKKSIPLWGIDFADSKYKSLSMSEDSTLTVYFDSWDEKILKVIFLNTIQFIYKLESTTKNLYELEGSLFLDEALQQEYGYKPFAHPFRHY